MQSCDARVDIASREPFRATLTSEGRTAVATGEIANQLTAYSGKRVIARGYCDVPGTFRVQSVVPVREHTIELATMSLCPYGVNAVSTIIEQLRRAPASGVPTEFSVRYLFSLRDPAAKGDAVNGASGETGSWSCLHGKPEMDENLVQMAIRDHLPRQFLGYVEARAKDLRADWRAVATSVGFTAEQLGTIAGLIEADRDGMIQREYDYLNRTLGSPQASPTYYWESQRVESLQRIPGFESTGSGTSGSCAGKH
jgi:hypothetical protein